MASDWKSKIASFFRKSKEEREKIVIFDLGMEHSDFFDELVKDPPKFKNLEFLKEIVGDNDEGEILKQIIKHRDVQIIWGKLYDVLQLEGLKTQIRPLFKKGDIFLGAGIAGVRPNDARMAQQEDDGGPLDRNVYKQMVDNIKKHKKEWTNFLGALGIKNGSAGETGLREDLALTPFGINLQNFRDALDALFDDFRDDEDKHYKLPPARQNFDDWREVLESSANTFFEKLKDVEDNWNPKKEIPFDDDIKNFKSLFDAVLFNSPAAKDYFENLAVRYNAGEKDAEKYNFYNTRERQNSAAALATFLSKKEMSKKERPSGEKPKDDETETKGENS